MVTKQMSSVEESIADFIQVEYTSENIGLQRWSFT